MGSMLPYIAAPWILWVLCVSSFFVCPLCTWWVLQPWCPAKLPLHTPSPGAAVEARAKGSGRGATQRRTSWPWNGKIHGAPHVICWNWWNMGICSDLGFCCYILWWSWSLSYVYMYICIYVYHTYIYSLCIQNAYNSNSISAIFQFQPGRNVHSYMKKYRHGGPCGAAFCPGMMSGPFRVCGWPSGWDDAISASASPTTGGWSLDFGLGKSNKNYNAGPPHWSLLVCKPRRYYSI